MENRTVLNFFWNYVLILITLIAQNKFCVALEDLDLGGLLIQKSATSESFIDCEVRGVMFDLENNFETRRPRCIPYSSNGGRAISNIILDFSPKILEDYDEIHSNGTKKFVRLHDVNLIQQSNEGEDEKSYKIQLGKKARIEVQSEPVGSERLLKAAGSRNVLVVRVTAKDNSLTQTPQDLSDTVFGPIGSMKSQYKACSMGKLNFEMAKSNDIMNGVIDLFVNSNVAGVKATDFENLVNIELVKKVGNLDLFDHVIYCFPEGTKGPSGRVTWEGYSYIGWNRVIINGEECSHLSHYMHEVGHNLGLNHSGRRGRKYDDGSDYMGYSINGVRWPLMCFNGAKVRGVD